MLHVVPRDTDHANLRRLRFAVEKVINELTGRMKWNIKRANESGRNEDLEAAYSMEAERLSAMIKTLKDAMYEPDQPEPPRAA